MTVTIIRYELNLLMKHEEVSMFQKISEQGTVQLLKDTRRKEDLEVPLILFVYFISSCEETPY